MALTCVQLPCAIFALFLYVLSSTDNLIICCLPLIGCSVLIGPPQWIGLFTYLMISARHNNFGISYILIIAYFNFAEPKAAMY